MTGRHRAPSSTARLSPAFIGAMVAATSLLVAGVATASPAVIAAPHTKPLPAPMLPLPPLSVATAALYLTPLPPAPAPAAVVPTVVETAVEKPAAVTVKATGTTGGLAARALSTALSFRGVHYVYGGTSRSGVDCSGLTQLAFRAAGVTLPRTAAAQSTVGRSVRLSDIQPGDLIFYYAPIEHVVMAAGNGMIVEASQPGVPVHVVPLYTNGLVSIRRIVG
jgi:cell wall-associated NlpC family hydrolase